MFVGLLLATSTPNRATTFLALFFGQVLAWAGVPALGAAAAGAAGALASQGKVHLWAVLVAGTLGAELGALGGWWLGQHFARTRLEPEPEPEGRFAGRRRKALEAGERVAQKWGRLIVFFVPSWVSGALGMSFRRFAIWNLLAAALWNLGAALAAYGVGSAASGGSLGKFLVPLVLGLLALGAIALIAQNVLHRRGHHHQPQADA